MANVHGRESGLRNAMRVRDIMGLYTFLGAEEPDAPFGGAQEVRQRGAAGQRHAGGSTNIAKVVLARRIGISRTQERPAPTPPQPAKADQTIDKVERASLEALSTFPETFACLPHPILPPPLGKGYSRPLHGESQRGGRISQGCSRSCSWPYA